MDFKLTDKEIRLVLDELYYSWDMAREDLEKNRAGRIAKVRDKLVEQYKKQEIKEKNNVY